MPLGLGMVSTPAGQDGVGVGGGTAKEEEQERVIARLTRQVDPPSVVSHVHFFCVIYA